MTYSEAGKGDAQRPTNYKKYGDGYDTIDWSAKEVKCPKCGEKFMVSSKHPHNHTCNKDAECSSTANP